ncbi:hypothetical protein EVG20_g11155, partial [Dentipellis fragilis]
MEGFLNLHPSEWFATQNAYLSAMSASTSPQYEFHTGGGVANPVYGQQPPTNAYPDNTNTYPANPYSTAYPTNTYPIDIVE